MKVDSPAAKPHNRQDHCSADLAGPGLLLQRQADSPPLRLCKPATTTVRLRALCLAAQRRTPLYGHKGAFREHLCGCNVGLTASICSAAAGRLGQAAPISSWLFG